MASLCIKDNNGSGAVRSLYRARLFEVLGTDEGTPGVPVSTEDPIAPGSTLNSLEASAILTPPCTESASKAVGGAASLSSGRTDCPRDVSPSSSGIGLDQAAKQIAHSLMDMLAQAIKGMNQETACDHRTLAATADGLARISEEVHRLSGELSTFGAQITSLAGQQSTLESSLATMNNRLCQEEENSREVHDGLVRLSNAHEDNTQKVASFTTAIPGLEDRILEVGERLEVSALRHREQSEVSVRLNSQCARLEQALQQQEQRLDSQEETLQQLHAEIRQPTVVLERLLCSFRSLDLRTEPRLPLDAPVKVMFLGDGETEIAGRITNASERGLGMMLEAPVLPGTELRIDAEGSLRKGKVAHCGAGGKAYSVGVRLAHPLQEEGNRTIPASNEGRQAKALGEEL